MKIYSFDDAELNKAANVAMGQVLNGLVGFGEITAEQRDAALNNYALVVSQKGIFGRAFDLLFDADTTDRTMVYKLVRLHPQVLPQTTETRG